MQNNCYIFDRNVIVADKGIFFPNLPTVTEKEKKRKKTISWKYAQIFNKVTSLLIKNRLFLDLKSLFFLSQYGNSSISESYVDFLYDSLVKKEPLNYWETCEILKYTNTYMEQQHQLLHQHSTEQINRQYLHGANGKREIQREIHIPTTDNHSQMERSAVSNETDYHRIDATKSTPK